MHQAYGGVVPELASRDHIRRVLPLTARCWTRPARRSADIDVVAYTRGPGPGRRAAGRRRRGLRARRGAGQAGRWACITSKGHLLSPFLSADPPRVPVRRAAGVGRPHPADAGRRRRPLRAARRDDRRRRRRGLRQVGQAARPGLPRRAGAGAPGRARRPDGLRAAAAAAAQRQPRLLVRRPEDRRAHAGAEAGGNDLRAAARRSGRRDAGGDRRRAGAQVDGGAAADRLRRMVVAGGVGANAALRERWMPNARSARSGCTTRNWRCAPTTAR